MSHLLTHIIVTYAEIRRSLAGAFNNLQKLGDETLGPRGYMLKQLKICLWNPMTKRKTDCGIH